MAKDPAFLFYPGDYLRDTQCLSEKAQVAYDRIMCEHMRNICISKEQLNFFTKKLTEEEKAEVTMVLNKISGGYQIYWVAQSIEKRKEYSESRRNNRKKRVERHDNISNSYVKHMENEIEDENTNEIEKENALAGDFQLFIDLFNNTAKRAFKGDGKAERQFAARIKEGYTVAQFTKAIQNCLKDDFHVENPKYLTPEFITRADKLEKYLNWSESKTKHNGNGREKNLEGVAEHIARNNS